jgi:hypothetical protein
MRAETRKSLQVHGLGVAACSLLTAVAVLTVVLPLKRERAAEIALRGLLEAAWQTAREAEQRQATLTRWLEDARARLQSAGVRLQPPGNLNLRLAEIAALVDASSMVTLQTELGRTRAERHYQTIEIKLTGTGRYSDCAAFLHRLRTSMPDMGVVSFDLSGNPRAAAAPANFRFDLVWYAAPALAASPLDVGSPAGR